MKKKLKAFVYLADGVEPYPYTEKELSVYLTREAFVKNGATKSAADKLTPCEIIYEV